MVLRYDCIQLSQALVDTAINPHTPYKADNLVTKIIITGFL